MNANFAVLPSDLVPKQPFLDRPQLLDARVAVVNVPALAIDLKEGQRVIATNASRA